jgi:hypothetical protein
MDGQTGIHFYTITSQCNYCGSVQGTPVQHAAGQFEAFTARVNYATTLQKRTHSKRTYTRPCMQQNALSSSQEEDVRLSFICLMQRSVLHHGCYFMLKSECSRKIFSEILHWRPKGLDIIFLYVLLGIVWITSGLYESAYKGIRLLAIYVINSCVIKRR